MNVQVAPQSQVASEEIRGVVVSKEDAPVRLRRIDLTDAARRALTTTEEKLRAASGSFPAPPK